MISFFELHGHHQVNMSREFNGYTVRTNTFPKSVWFVVFVNLITLSPGTLTVTTKERKKR